MKFKENGGKIMQRRGKESQDRKQRQQTLRFNRFTPYVGVTTISCPWEEGKGS